MKFGEKRIDNFMGGPPTVIFNKTSARPQPESPHRNETWGGGGAASQRRLLPCSTTTCSPAPAAAAAAWLLLLLPPALFLPCCTMAFYYMACLHNMVVKLMIDSDK